MIEYEMDYRLTFYDLIGFDIKGFETKEEAIEYAKKYGKLGLITPQKLMKYDAASDTYKVIGNFVKKQK